LIAIGIPVGCVALLTEAYFRTDLRDAEAPSNCAFEASSGIIKEHHVRELEKKGVVIIRDALGPAAVLAARKDICDFRDGGSSNFILSGNDDDVRQDKVAWIKDNINSRTAECQSSDAPKLGEDLARCIRLVRGIANALEKMEYTGSFTHKVPRECQLAMYRGDGLASYERHLDRCISSLEELGLLEWLRLSDYRGRSITAILYLNAPDRPVRDGGALRCWVARDGTSHASSIDDDDKDQKPDDLDSRFSAPFDVQPTGGTLIIFQSDKVEHMVLPSVEDRYALTSWVSGSLVDPNCA
jgi:hypothetical protein